MKWKSETVLEKIILISRRIFWSFMALFFLTGLMNEFAEHYAIKWLQVIVPFVGNISLILLVISWIMPGIFILLGTPWLSRAWLRGVNPIVISAEPWDRLSVGNKLLTYFWSITISIFILLATIGFLIHTSQK